MELNFTITHQILKRTDENVMVNKSKNYINCIFIFKTNEWNNQEKIAIFRNEKGETFEKYIGRDNECSCIVPNAALSCDFFTVSVYAGNQITTNEKIVVLLRAGYRNKHHHHHEYDGDKDIFIQIFEKLNDKIDDIIINDGVLSVRRGDVIDSLADFITIDSELSLTSDNAVANSVITSALQNKADNSMLSNVVEDVTLIVDTKFDELPTVAKTGNYEDLTNIPEEFTPAKHTHESSDVTDLDNNIDLDLNNLLDSLTDSIRLI